MQDRRRYPRAPISADVELIVSGQVSIRRIANVSEGGAFIDTPRAETVGTFLHIRFPLEHQRVEAEARVVFAQPSLGIGIEFTTISPDQIVALRRYVDRANQPALA